MDEDGDGFGDDNQTVERCTPDLGLATVGGDCDDSNIYIAPNALELCDGIDNNCNDTIDEGVTTTFYLDGDTDGFGDDNQPIEACEHRGRIDGLKGIATIPILSFFSNA